MYNHKGEPESMVIMVKNNQERKEAEEDLRKAKEKAEEADRLKTAFLFYAEVDCRRATALNPCKIRVVFIDYKNIFPAEPFQKFAFCPENRL